LISKAELKFEEEFEPDGELELERRQKEREWRTHIQALKLKKALGDCG